MTEWSAGPKVRFSLLLSPTNDNIADGKGRSAFAEEGGGSEEDGPGNDVSTADTF